MKYINLTRKLKSKVCDCHYEAVSELKWQAGSHGYAMREQHLGMKDGKKIRKTVLLHRFIMNTPKEMDTDHINGDKLDNRCSNLRVVTTSQNLQNRGASKSGYKGATKRPNGKYQAYIGRPRITIGTYDTLKEALDAYDEKALELYGDYAKLNRVAIKR